MEVRILQRGGIESNMLQGDVHRFYRNLRRRWPVPPGNAISDLDMVREIQAYYAGVSPSERQLLLAWVQKEEAGIGLIPLVLSGVPFVTLIFAPMIQAKVREMAAYVWVILWLVGALTLIAGLWIHQRQRAFTALHLALLRDLCGKGNGPASGPPG